LLSHFSLSDSHFLPALRLRQRLLTAFPACEGNDLTDPVSQVSDQPRKIAARRLTLLIGTRRDWQAQVPDKSRRDPNAAPTMSWRSIDEDPLLGSFKLHTTLFAGKAVSFPAWILRRINIPRP
jgi:hypothetical protein